MSAHKADPVHLGFDVDGATGADAARVFESIVGCLFPADVHAPVDSTGCVATRWSCPDCGQVPRTTAGGLVPLMTFALDAVVVERQYVTGRLVSASIDYGLGGTELRVEILTHQCATTKGRRTPMEPSAARPDMVMHAGDESPGHVLGSNCHAATKCPCGPVQSRIYPTALNPDAFKYGVLLTHQPFTGDEGDPQHCVVDGVVIRDQTAGDLGLCGAG